MERKKLVIPFIKTLFTNPGVILKALYHGMVEEDRKQFVQKQYNMSNGLPEVDLKDLFGSFDEKIDTFSHLYGTSLPIDLAIIKKIAMGIPNCDYLEIGSWRGESLANIAPVVKRCVSVSLSDELMRQFGISEEAIKVQRFFSHNIPNIEHIGADSTKFDFSKLGKFDLIFVDGDHRFEAVKSDTTNVFNLLKDENSIILWHDYTKNYEQINWEVFSGMLAGIPKDKLPHVYHITNSLLAIYTTKNVKTSRYSFPSYPNKKFTLTFKMENL